MGDSSGHVVAVVEYGNIVLREIEHSAAFVAVVDGAVGLYLCLYRPTTLGSQVVVVERVVRCVDDRGLYLSTLTRLSVVPRVLPVDWIYPVLAQTHVA